MDISESTKAQAKREIEDEIKHLQLFAGYFQSFSPREHRLIDKLIEERARFLTIQDAVRRMPV